MSLLGKSCALRIASVALFLSAVVGARENAKTDLEDIFDALRRGEPQEVLVEFDSRPMLRKVQAMGEAKGSPSKEREILRRIARESSALKAATLASLPAADLDVLKNYSHLPMALMRVRSVAALERLLGRTEVVAVRRNKRIRKLLTQSLPLIRQPQAAAAGHRGTGTTVAVIDGGVDYTRDAFGNCTSPGVPATCKVVAFVDFGEPDGSLDDLDLHGTNVAGIVLGVAPDSRIAALDIFQGDQGGSFGLLFDAMNWAIENKAQYNIVAMNLSLGVEETPSGPCADAGFSPAFSLARAAGMLPVVASGNDGDPLQMSIPACDPLAVSVGAVYDSNVGSVGGDCSDPTTTADQITCFSNRSDGLTLFAPGAFITAAGTTQAGTSQATPHASGAIAVLKGSYPTEVPQQTVARLTSTGTLLTDPLNSRLKPRINLEAAAAAPPPPPPPPPSNCPATAVSCPFTTTTDLTATDCTAGHLGSAHFTDVYEFQGTAGQTVTINMSSTAAPDFDSYLILVSPSGTIAAQNDDIVLGVDVNSRLVFTLNASGTWRIEASTFAPDTVGTYTLSIVGCSPPPPQVCTPGASTLCLSGGRFRVQATWRRPDGSTGAGTAVGLTADTGYFWFFEPANVEMVVKILNACGFAQRFWVFSGGLTNVQVTLTVTDTVTGAVKTYVNPQGTAYLPIQDTQAFSNCPSPASAIPTFARSDPPTAPKAAPTLRKAGMTTENRAGSKTFVAAACTPTANALCLSGGRFRVSTTWRRPDGSTGSGTAVSLTSDTGYFWFFDPANVEMLAKVLNACGFAQRIWVFSGGLTNVEVTLTVEDTNNGNGKTYTNPQGTAFLPIQDTEAFSICP